MVARPYSMLGSPYPSGSRRFALEGHGLET
jgi:hypothetical protein